MTMMMYRTFIITGMNNVIKKPCKRFLFYSFLCWGIKVFNEVDSIDFIKQCINDYSLILVDYLELLGINKDELLELKELVKKENKTLIIISCCSANKELMNNDHYNELKEIADLMILTDK